MNYALRALKLELANKNCEIDKYKIYLDENPTSEHYQNEFKRLNTEKDDLIKGIVQIDFCEKNFPHSNEQKAYEDERAGIAESEMAKQAEEETGQFQIMHEGEGA